MKRRDLKKIVNYTCSELFAECVAASLYNTKADQADVDALLKSILVQHQDFICRISHVEPGMKAKRYFKAYKNDFAAKMSEVIDHIANLH